MDEPVVNIVLCREIPPLPVLADRQFSNNIIRAHRIVHNAYQHGWKALYASDSDPHRLRIHSVRLRSRMLPLLLAMETPLNDEGWTIAVATLLAQLIVSLEESATFASLQ